jgi:2-polyprenyl-6-methoxyphenol hydroxylase-like FAD-dependent oxidoreductase
VPSIGSRRGNPRRILGIPRPTVERLLTDHAIELGVEIRRSCELVGLSQDDHAVTADLADGTHLRSRYLVGCDGRRSPVRKLLGVGSPGEPARRERLSGDVELTAPPEEVAAAVTEVRETQKGFGVGPSREGLYRFLVPAGLPGFEPATLDPSRRPRARERSPKNRHDDLHERRRCAAPSSIADRDYVWERRVAMPPLGIRLLSDSGAGASHRWPLLAVRQRLACRELPPSFGRAW